MAISKIVTIIGGLGPFAGLDVLRKFYENTTARRDEDFIDVVYISLSSGVPDRTDYLLEKTGSNPGEILAEKIKDYPMDIVAFACNTLHAPPIYKVLTKKVKEQNSDIRILHIPLLVKEFILQYIGSQCRLGVLSTIGTYNLCIYQDALKEVTPFLIFPEENGRDDVHRAIYEPQWGIKATGRLNDSARHLIQHQINILIESGVDAFLLGCTELPFVSDELDFSGITVIDPNLILARALILEAAPHKLKLIINN